MGVCWGIIAEIDPLLLAYGSLLISRPVVFRNANIEKRTTRTPGKDSP